MKCSFCGKDFQPTPCPDINRMRFCGANCRYRSWCANNPIRAREIMMKSKSKRKEKNRVYAQAYYLRNKHKQYLYTRKWREANRARNVQQVVDRMARVRGAKGSFTFQEWLEVKKKHNSCCALCGKHESEVKLTRDHIIPITKGGSNYISNIQPLCGSCNSRKSNHL